MILLLSNIYILPGKKFLYILNLSSHASLTDKGLKKCLLLCTNIFIFLLWLLMCKGNSSSYYIHSIKSIYLKVMPVGSIFILVISNSLVVSSYQFFSLLLIFFSFHSRGSTLILQCSCYVRSMLLFLCANKPMRTSEPYDVCRHQIIILHLF